LGPFQSGKTTLLEAILVRTGAIQRQGTVEAGTTVGDASRESRHHTMSVELTVATTTFMGDSYTFIDCPGSVEFIHDMRAVLPFVDAAVVVCHHVLPNARHAGFYRLDGRNRVLLARRNLPWPLAWARSSRRASRRRTRNRRVGAACAPACCRSRPVRRPVSARR